jgi:hypothetical protein
LADICPYLVLPGHTLTISEHLAALLDDPESVRLIKKGWMKPL